MRDRGEPILRIACLVLAGLLLWQLVKVARRFNPLGGVAIPPLPALATDTNSPAAAKGTNAIAAHPAAGPGTNHLRAEAATNNSTAPAVTNFATAAWTHSGFTNTTATNAPVVATFSNVISAKTNFAAGTNASAPGATNLAPAGTNTGANLVGPAKQKQSGGIPPGPAGMALPGMNFGPPGLGGGPAPELPPAIKARVDRIYESEILGQVMRPLPMALLGIAGNVAFLRAPSGQTGLVKAGDLLGEIKLLRIGTNRVLVEQDGKKTELMIFEGYGGESLMPKEKETPK